jgi:RNA polymerase sigma-70 factor (ECF subfamily)
MTAEIPDGDLVRLARDGDRVAFRLLVERHQPMARARAARLLASPGDVDDVVQESFLQAFLALDRIRDPDRFAAWLAGIVLNVCRGLQRRAPVTLLPEWPERLHPASAEGLPSADDLDRADALRAAVAELPAGQRQAITLRYYADLPPGQIAESSGAARASLHKARLRLRAFLTEHRPDLVPAVSRRSRMTIVKIERVELGARPVPPGPPRRPSHVVVLADEAGQRELPVWLLGFDGLWFARLLRRRQEGTLGPDGGAVRDAGELADRLLRAAGASVTRIDIDELGPEVTAARIQLASRAGARQVTARLAEGLAIAVATGAPVRVADGVMDRQAVPAASAGTRSPAPAAAGPATARAVTPGPEQRPRYEPRNLSFANGLDRWLFAGSFAEHASESHWQDYACTVREEPGQPAAGAHAGARAAVLAATVPEPAGFAFLAQAMFADDYRGVEVAFRGEFRSTGAPRRAGLFLRVKEGPELRGPLTEETVFADPDFNVVTVAGTSDWRRYESRARVPDAQDMIIFGIFLAGPGQIELRNAELARTG